MHYKNDFAPYASTADGISRWVETATCVAVKQAMGKLSFLWCHGMDDVLGLIARPVEEFKSQEMLPVFRKRIQDKGWRARWPHLVVEDS